MHRQTNQPDVESVRKGLKWIVDRGPHGTIGRIVERAGVSPATLERFRSGKNVTWRSYAAIKSLVEESGYLDNKGRPGSTDFLLEPPGESDSGAGDNPDEWGFDDCCAHIYDQLTALQQDIQCVHIAPEVRLRQYQRALETLQDYGRILASLAPPPQIPSVTVSIPDKGKG